MYGVVVQVVSKLQGVIGHHVRFLRDRRGDPAPVDPIQRLRVLIESNDRDLYVQAMQRFRRTRTAGSFQADDAVDFRLGFQQCGHIVIRDARITLIINCLDDLHTWVFLQRVGHSSGTLVQVQLAGDGNDHYLSLAFHNVCHSLGAFTARAVIVRANEHHALRIGGVRIHRNHRNTLGNGSVYGVLKQFGTGY